MQRRESQGLVKPYGGAFVGRPCLSWKQLSPFPKALGTGSRASIASVRKERSAADGFPWLVSGGGVPVFHEPSRLISSDRKERDIRRAKTLGDVEKDAAVAISGVAGPPSRQ
jgi:hypothetical protein